MLARATRTRRQEGAAGPDVRCQRSEASDPSSDICHPTSEVNLELWAKGEARYLPGKVFAAIRERYNKSVTTFADAIEFLVNDVKLVTKEQASPALLSMGGVARAKEEA